MKKYLFFAFALAAGAMTFTSCSDDDDDEKEDSVYSDKTYGQEAIQSCINLEDQLTAANQAIAGASLTDDQEETLYKVIDGVVDNVIIPTYTKLADYTEVLYSSLNGLTTSSITQNDVDDACEAFLNAREWWEKSEAFLGGAASDFDIDPTIDSWPLNRSLLLSYFKDGEFSEEALEDASILGFHALEFILFRNGSPRKYTEFQGYDTYKNFTTVKGSAELAYAQQVCELLLQRTYQLQIAWEGVTSSNSSRAAIVDAAGLKITTEKGLTYGDNLKTAGKSSMSTFSTLQAGIAQILSLDEGSCWAICDEVGSAKIANPFSKADISYVESPYSYNSITDFQNNIRSIEDVWYGGTNGSKSGASNSFHKFFEDNQSKLGDNVEDAISEAIDKIGDMPYPFVKYISTIWNKTFEDE